MKTISRTNVFSAKAPEYPNTSSNSSLETSVAACVSELMNAATSFHKLHLKITGIGSYAGHKALNELYDALPDHADDLAEGLKEKSNKKEKSAETNKKDSKPAPVVAAETKKK